MIKKLRNTLFPGLFTQDPAANYVQSYAKAEHDLLKKEAAIGGQLFGPVPSGHRRDFFCLDDKTWIWHEEWLDAAQQQQSLTTRYEVRPNGIIKVQDGQPYRFVTGQELQNFNEAVTMYTGRVVKEVYGQ